MDLNADEKTLIRMALHTLISSNEKTIAWLDGMKAPAAVEANAQGYRKNLREQNESAEKLLAKLYEDVEKEARG